MNTAKRCDEDEYPARPAQRAAVLVKGGEVARGKDHLGATELNGNALKPRRLASLSALSGSGQARSNESGTAEELRLCLS